MLNNVGTILAMNSALSKEGLYCCDNLNATCTPCTATCTETIQLECQPASVRISKPQCPLLPTSNEMPTSMAESTMKEPQQNQNSQFQTAVIVILGVTLLATAVGWMITCAVARKKRIYNNKQR